MEYARELYNTYEQVGLPLMTDEFACKLLAWLSVMGIYSEEPVINTKLNTGLSFAQKKLNIIKGQLPNIKLIPLLNKYTQELKDKGDNVEWLTEIYLRYGFKPNKL